MVLVLFVHICLNIRFSDLDLGKRGLTWAINFLTPKVHTSQRLALIQEITYFYNIRTLVEKKIKFSSHKRKFRRERLQSHIWLTASSYMVNICAFPNILGSPSSYMTLQPYEFTYIWGNFFLFFIFISAPWNTNCCETEGVINIFTIAFLS
jgi:hypothetical protein